MLSMKPLTRASAVQTELPPMRLLTKASAVEAGVSPMEPLRAADKSSIVEAGVATTAPSLSLSRGEIERPHSEDESENQGLAQHQWLDSPVPPAEAQSASFIRVG